MTSLKFIAAPLALALGVTGLAAPASAQWQNHGRQTPMRTNAIRDQINDLQRRVERNDYRQRVSPREAAGLRQDVFRLQSQFQAYNRDGLSPREYSWLNGRIGQIRSRLQIERNDRGNRRY